MAARQTLTSRRVRTRLTPYSIRSPDLTTQYINVDTDFDPASHDWTLMLWAKFNRLPYQFTPTFDHNLYSQQDGTGTGRSWLFVDRTNQNKLATFFGGAGTVWTYTVDQGPWHRYCVTFEQSTRNMELFVDGVSYGTITPAAIESASGVHVLMNNKAGIGGMYGNMCDVILVKEKYTSAKAQTDFYDGQPDLANVDYRLLFSEGAGTSLADLSGNSNTGTLTGGTWDSDVPFKARNPITQARQSLGGARVAI